MNTHLLVAIGGALGSVARYQLSIWIVTRTVEWRFPLQTFVVNVLGCLVVGVMFGLLQKQDWFSEETRLLLFTGIAGGFTTFSSFGLETFTLLRRNDWAVAGAYVGLSIIVGLALLAAGYGLVPAKTA